MTPSPSTYLLAGAGLTAATLLALPGVASAAWSVHSGQSTTRATAAWLPTGGQPAARLGSAKSSLTISWPGRTVADGVSVGGYRLTRVNADTGGSATPGGTCDGVVAATSCTDTGIPDGSWTYQVRTVLGTRWIGPWGPQSAPILVDTTPTRAAVTFPVAEAEYTHAQVAAGCPVAGFCGTAAATAGTSISEIRVTLQRTAKGQSGKALYWDPARSAFTSDTPKLLPVTVSGQSWRTPFSGFDASRQSYVLSVVVIDSAGGTATRTVSFTVK